MTDGTERGDDEMPSVSTADIERRAVRGGAITGAAQALKGLADVGGGLFLARALSPADFGLVDMIVSATGILDLLRDFGLSSATISREHLSHAQVNALYWINVGIGAGLSLLTALLAPLLALGYARPELLDLTLALSASSLLGGLSIQQQALMRRNLQFGRLAVIDVLSALIATALAVFGALSGWGAWALVLRQLSKLGIQALLTSVLSPWQPRRWRAANVRELLRVGTHISGYQLLNFCERNFDNVLIGRFSGPAALGFYTRAYDLMRFPLNQINVPIAVVAVPALSRLAPEPARYKSAYRALTRLLLLATVPLAPLFIFIAPVLIPLVLGPQWAGAVPLVQWLSAGLLLKPLVFTTSWLFISQSRTAELFRFGLFATTMALIAFVVGLPWGALGVAVSYTLSDLLLRGPLMLWWAGRTGPVGVRDFLYCLGPAWTCALAESLAFWLLWSLTSQLEPGLRTALCAPVALLLGALAVVATPWGRAAIRDGASMLKTLRTQR